MLGTRQDEVHVPDGRRAQRPEAVPTATVVATMLDGGAVLDNRPPRNSDPGIGALRIKRVQDVRIPRTDLDLA